MASSLLQVRKLVQAFHGRLVLDHIDFEVSAGEFVAVIGPSGCGKTVLLRTIAGLIRPKEGTVWIEGGADASSSPVGIAFQDAALIPWLTVLENITLCVPSTVGNRQRKRELARGLLAETGLIDFESQYPHEMSGGMRQKINVVRSFASDARLLLMDEPFVSLDFLQRRRLQVFTRDFCASKGKTVIFVTHDLDEALRLADRILVISALPGRILNDFRTSPGHASEPQRTLKLEIKRLLFNEMERPHAPAG